MNNEIATTEKKEIATEEQLGLRGLLNSDIVKKRFAEVLGREAAVFSASILTIYNGSDALQKCVPKSILNAAFQAAGPPNEGRVLKHTDLLGHGRPQVADLEYTRHP